MRRPLRRIVALISLVALGAVIGGCALEPPFARTNPFDQGGVLRMSLSGPDSAVYSGQRIRFTIEADRPITPEALIIGWRTSDGTVLIAGAQGEFVVGINATARFMPIEVTALFDSVRVSRTVLVGQTAATLDLWCGAIGGPLVACDANPVVAGTTVTVRATMTDSSTTTLRQPLYALQRAVLSSSDSAVVRPAMNAAGNGTLSVVAVAPGAAWIRARVDGAVDSVRLVVR